MTTVHVREPQTNLRKGGAVDGPDNVIMVLGNPATYEAVEQCIGEEVVETPFQNKWWVRILVPATHGTTVTGWVSVVRCVEGDNDLPVPGVPQSPTIFVSSSDGHVGG